MAHSLQLGPSLAMQCNGNTWTLVQKLDSERPKRTSDVVKRVLDADLEQLAQFSRE